MEEFAVLRSARADGRQRCLLNRSRRTERAPRSVASARRPPAPVRTAPYLIKETQRLPRHKPSYRLLIKIVGADAYAGFVDIPPCLPKQLIEHILVPDLIDHATCKILDSQELPPDATLPLGARVTGLRRGRYAQFGSERSHQLVTPCVVTYEPEGRQKPIDRRIFFHGGERY
jgi:hypothetical protein